MMHLTMLGCPRSKKNSMQLIRIGRSVKPIPSKAYLRYEKSCMEQLTEYRGLNISRPLSVKCVYYMETRRKVDLVNLLEATCDILVKAQVLKDDNSGIVHDHDGSRVLYDKENPRVEIRLLEV